MGLDVGLTLSRLFGRGVGTTEGSGRCGREVGVGVGVRTGVGVGEWVVFNAITFLSLSGVGGGGVVMDVGASR